MTSPPITFSSVLVPIDFSDTSLEALASAVRTVGEAEEGLVILQHVIDVALVEFAVQHNFGSREEVVERMREKAHHELDAAIDSYVKESGQTHIEYETVLSLGLPFLEIIRKAEEFQVDAIVMGRFGIRGKVEKLFFGTTAERVFRLTSVPVIVFP